MLKISDIHLRDPYILPYNGIYYLYGTRGENARGKCSGLDVYMSDNLVDWSEAYEVFTKPDGFWSDMDYWAPEVHIYKGSFYMFATFKSAERRRGTQILKADSPMGPFLPISEYPQTPPGWECLDGTFYVSKKGTPYMVFSHEWKQITDGEICALRLSEDLTRAVGEPFVLFCGSSPEWAGNQKYYVTDGPFMYRTKSDRLIMIWSGFTGGAERKYVESVAYSDNGEIDGEWKHEETLLFENDGGHGMIFKSFTNEVCFIMHTPNHSPDERPVIIKLRETDKGLMWEKEIRDE
ncbi:MAG: family 43 glycosylhydrolase [Clostridia bacterium]|nr:family 43 glycosylhydrolase [Clostridia bacterium]